MSDLIELKGRLKKTYHSFVDEYQRSVEASYQKQVAMLRTGEMTPKVKRLVGDDRTAFEERARYYRTETEKIIKDAEDSIKDVLSEAPSTEAVNYVSMMSMRGDLTQADIDAAIEKYGSNYSAYSAIASIGRKQPIKLHTAPHEVDRARDFIKLAGPICSSMTLEKAENGGATIGRASFYDMSIDQT